MGYRKVKALVAVSAAFGSYVAFNYKIPDIQTHGEPYQVLPRASISDHPNLFYMTKFPETIGIVGGGIAGCITAKTLAQQGYKVEVLEKSPSFGGLWYSNYDGSGLQFHYGHYNLPDFSFPPGTVSLPRSAEVTKFIEAYARHFSIDRNFQFNTAVSSIKQNSDNTWTVLTNKGSKNYDFLILCTGPYNKPHIPSIKGSGLFKGKIIHSSEFVNSEALCRGKKVVVIGSGKSAYDIMAQAHTYGAHVEAIMRKAHWFTPPDLTIFGLSRGIFTASRMAGWFLDPFYTEKNTFFSGTLGDLYWGMLEKFLKRGVPSELLPSSKLKQEKHFRGGARDEKVFDLVRNGEVKIHRGASFEFYERGLIVEKNKVEADLVVLATGFDREYFGIEPEDDGLWMYRNVIVPGKKNFAIVGITNTYCNPLYTNIQAVWLSEVLRGRVRLPGEFSMREDILKRRAYTKKIINGESTISFSWYPIPMIDQFLEDMGLQKERKSNIIDYWFDPIKPEDYQEVITHRA